MTSEEWSYWWGLLAERFNRERDPDLGAFYLDELEERLSDAEIEAGVERVLYQNTYFPSPKELVEAGRQNIGEGPEEEWQRVLLLAKSQREKEPYPEEEHARPDPAAMRALASIGGVDAINNADPRFVIRFRQAFLEAYEAFAEEPSHERLLPEGGDRTLIDEGDDDG